MFSPVTTLQIVAFLDLLAAGLIVPQLPSQARGLGCNHVLIGFMGSVYPSFQLISSPMTGSVSDLKGRLETLFVTLTMSGIAYTLLGVTNSVFLFITLRAFLGITKHTQLLAKAIAPDYVKDSKKLSQIYGRLSALKRAGMSIAPIISGHIMETFPENGFTIIAFIVGAIFILNSGLVRRLASVKNERKKTEKREKPIAPPLLSTIKTSFDESVNQFYKIDWNKYWEIFSFKLFISLCTGVYISNYVLFLKIKHGVTPITTGYIISLFPAIGSLTSLFISYINKIYDKDKDYTERNLHVFGILTVSLLGVTFAPDVPMYVVFIIPLGIASAVGSLITQEIILCKTDNDQRGTVMGVANNIRSVTGTVTPLITGIIAQYVGVLYVVYVAIFLAALGTYKSYVIRLKSVAMKQK